MIPLRAENPRRTFAVINLLLIVLNVVVFLYQVSLPRRAAERLVDNLGVVPARAQQFVAPTKATTRTQIAPRTESAILAFLTTLFTSMFPHSGLLHLLGNMLFLWVFGASVEDHIGHIPYLMFYLICGIGAGITHILANWARPSHQSARAERSRAYIVLFPRSKILTLVLVIIFFFTVRLPAILFLGYWFLIQFLSGFLTLGDIDQSGVAWWAHIGGFLLGAFLAWGT